MRSLHRIAHTTPRRINHTEGQGATFDGASLTCSSEVFAGPGEASEAETRNEHWVTQDVPEDQVRQQHPHPRRLLHVGPAPTRPGPRDAAGAEHRRGEVLLRGGGHDPVAHPLLAQHGDPAAARRPDRGRPVLGGRQLGRRAYYKRGIIAYSFEAGAQRLTVNQTTGAITRAAVGFQPCFGGPGTQGGQGSSCTTGNPPVPNP